MNEIDDIILKEAQSGSIKAFEKIVYKFERLVYNIAFKMLKNPEDASDLSQEALIKIYKNLNKCQDASVLKAWVCRITTNACIDEIRKRKGKTYESLDFEIEHEEGDFTKEYKSSEEGPEQVLINKELRIDIAKAIDKLAPSYRALIVLRDVEGLSYLELAEITESNLGTVKSRLSRARNMLKKIIIDMQKNDVQ